MHISPSATLCGEVIVQEGAYIGAGAIWNSHDYNHVHMNERFLMIISFYGFGGSNITKQTQSNLAGINTNLKHKY